MNRKTWFWKAALPTALLVIFSTFCTAAAAEPERKSVAVSHPNLLLNLQEIEQIKLKVRDQPWAAHLLELVKTKADKDDPAIECALAHALTGEGRYARKVHDRLIREAREEMRHYEKIDVKAEPEWGRWSHWGATAWAYDLAFDTCLLYTSDAADERSSVDL